jgi:hypothetical protein
MLLPADQSLSSPFHGKFSGFPSSIHCAENSKKGTFIPLPGQQSSTKDYSFFHYSRKSTQKSPAPCFSSLNSDLFLDLFFKNKSPLINHPPKICDFPIRLLFLPRNETSIGNHKTTFLKLTFVSLG